MKLGADKRSTARKMDRIAEGYTMTKSALHFPIDRPPPKALVEKLTAARLSETRGD